MLKRSVCFESAAHLSFKNGQLVYTPKPEGAVRTVPVEDIGFVVWIITVYVVASID